MDMIFSYLRDAMVELVLATVCAVIALIAVWKLAGDLLGSRGKANCPWRKDDNQPETGEARWVCATCGAFSLGQNGGPPLSCRKP